jgi:hypothetical protein
MGQQANATGTKVEKIEKQYTKQVEVKSAQE